MDGHFFMNLSNSKATVVVTYIGYAAQEINLNGKSELRVALKPDNQMLEEVVVTGYGTFKKSAYAGSASTVKTSTLQDVPTVSFSGLLQGSTPGVQISSDSGQPGSATSINIRGMGSFNASNQPLYVIDGVPVISGDVSTLGTTAGQDAMATINTSDIENITVIKDAAAASLYGSRAANGVILITTKKGQTGKPKISLKADWGSSDFAMDYRPVMTGEQRREYIYNALKTGQLLYGATEAEATAYADDEIDYYAPIPWCGYVDWDDVLFKKGSHSNYEASLSGGTDKFKYYSSLSYLDQEGIAINSGLERISGRLNVEYNASKQMTLGANMLFSHINQDVYSEGTSYTSPFYSSRNCVVPSDAVYNEDGSWNRDFIRNGDRNPKLSQTYDWQKEYTTRHFNTIWGQYEFIPNLKFKTTLSYDYSINKGKDWSDPRTSNGDDENGIMYKSMYERSKLVWANQLSYNITLKQNHHLDALIGYEVDDQRRDYLSAEKKNFANHDKTELSNGATLSDAAGSNTRTRMVSYLSRVNYDYKSKYFLGGSIRTDGSSRLASGNRWGTFWSLSGAWRAIEEDFMEPVRGTLTDLKLRLSYGVNGTLPSDYYGYYGLSSLTGDYMGDPAYSLSQIANDKLSWETNYNLNVGVDFSLWDRLSFTLEYYTRTTKDLLMDYAISMTTGFSSYLLNVGEVRNNGIELDINSKNFNTKNFSWTTGFNLAHNKNKIVALDGQQTEIISGTQIRRVGKSYRTFYLIEFAGINPETGSPQFYTNDLDENGNYIKEITEDPADANRIAMKHAEPTLTGGLTNNLRYKWFDLNFVFSYQFGGYSYDTWAQKTEHGGNDLEANIPTYYLNSWKNPGDITNYELFVEDPEVSMQSYATSRRLHSTDFIRLKNVTLGFNLPKKWLKGTAEGIRLYASASNLWTWAKYDYYDPEAVSDGSAIWGTPPLKTYTFGINVNF
jgi:TonB-linked SusC/RagA family outer membrane protein